MLLGVVAWVIGGAVGDGFKLQALQSFNESISHK